MFIGKTEKIDNLLSLHDLLEKLERLQATGEYVFRGHTRSNHILAPKAFRPEYVQIFYDEFSLAAKNEPRNSKPILDWINLQTIQNITNAWTRGLPLETAHNVKNALGSILLYILQYNFCLQKEIAHYLDKAGLTENESKLFYDIPAYSWALEDTFCSIFNYYYPSLIIYHHLNGELMQEPYLSKIDGDLARFNEAYPQHYGFPTMALDWTYNPYIALCFALGRSTKEEIPMALYIYKQKENNENTPVSIKKIDKNIHNKRSIVQEGTFTIFNAPIQFYLAHGHLPSLESYDDGSNFELIKYEIKRSHQNMELIEKKLVERGINLTSLLV